MGQDPADADVSILLLARLLLEKAIERFAAAIKSPSVMCWPEGLCRRMSQDGVGRLGLLVGRFAIAGSGSAQLVIGCWRREHRGYERFAISYIGEYHPLIPLDGVASRFPRSANYEVRQFPPA